MNGRLLILGASILQLPAIRQAAEMGLEVIVADMNPDAIGFKEPGIHKEIVSTTDTNSIIKLAEKYHIDGIMTLASDVPMPTIAAVCEKLGLCGISPETALNATNKAVMREQLKKCGVPIPDFYTVRTLEEFRQAASNFEDKFVVKASDNSGNRGIKIVHDITDSAVLEEAFNYAKKYTRDGRILLEEYMDGPEFSIEGISLNNIYYPIQLTDKITSGEPYFVELGHTQPSAQPDDVRKRIFEVAEAGVRALGIVNGPSHTEIKLTHNGPKIVEIGARLGGDCITTHLVPLSTGINMVKANIMTALGIEPDLTSSFRNGAAIRFITAKPGVLKEINGCDNALKISGIKEIGFLKNIGDIIPEMRTGLDRVGYIIAQCDTREEAVSACQTAMDMITAITE